MYRPVKIQYLDGQIESKTLSHRKMLSNACQKNNMLQRIQAQMVKANKNPVPKTPFFEMQCSETIGYQSFSRVHHPEVFVLPCKYHCQQCAHFWSCFVSTSMLLASHIFDEQHLWIVNLEIRGLEDTSTECTSSRHYALTSRSYRSGGWWT